MRLRTAAFLIIATGAALAQTDAPPGVLRGSFLNWSGTARKGQFTFQTASHQLYSCSYDQKTYVERSNQRISFASADRGERLELIADLLSESGGCYARLVKMLDVPFIPVSATTHSHPRPIAPFGARANLTVAGVVLRTFPDLLVLRLRTGAEDFIRLRSDTQYLAQGQAATVGSLRANTLVFIRAGRNLYGEVEAYQVIWGKILSSEP